MADSGKSCAALRKLDKTVVVWGDPLRGGAFGPVIEAEMKTARVVDLVSLACTTTTDPK